MQTVVYDPYERVSLEAFLPELRLEIPELPDDALAHYVLQACIEFCDRSKVLEREIVIRLQPCVHNYLLEPDDCSRLLMIYGVRRQDADPFDSRPLHYQNGYIRPAEENCHSQPLSHAYERLSERPTYNGIFGCSAWWDRVEGSIVLSPAPTQTGTVIVKGCVAPREDACEVDARLAREFRQAVLAGARMLLYAIPRKEWSSQPQAEVARADFMRRVAAAGTERLLGGQMGKIKARQIFSRWRKP